MDLVFGQKVASMDSWIGSVDAMWMNTDGDVVSQVVLKRGFPLSRRYIAPAATVRRTDVDGCYLNLTTETALALPNVRETHHDATTVILTKRSRIVAEAGLRFRLAGLRLTDDKVVTHLMTERQWPSNVIRLVPVESIVEVSPWRFTTDLSAEDFRHLPRYRPDRDIERAVREALYANESISDVDLNAAEVAVNGGNVTLTGNVRWPEAVRDIDATARSTPGVGEVDNRLINDRDVELRVAALIQGIDSALANTAEVNSQLGEVTIAGQVSDDGVRSLVGEAISSVAGVLGLSLDVTLAEPLAVATGVPEDVSESGEGGDSTQS